MTTVRDRKTIEGVASDVQRALEHQGPGGVRFVQPPGRSIPAELTLLIPAEISHLIPDLKRFFDAMVYKLRKNAAKGRWEKYSIIETLMLLRTEVEELDAAIQEGNDIEVVLEASDVANFAMIAAAIALEGRKR